MRIEDVPAVKWKQQGRLKRKDYYILTIVTLKMKFLYALAEMILPNIDVLFQLHAK